MPSLVGFRRRQPRSTPAALADPSIATIVPQAVSQLGGAVARAGVVGSQIVDRRNNELARADLEGMKAATATKRNEFVQSLRTTDKDYNGINQAWKDFKKKNFKLIGNTTKQQKAQKAYGMYIRGIIPQWDRDIDNIAWGVSAERAQVKVFNSAVSLLQTTPVFEEGLILANQTIERSKLLTPEQKDLVFANAVIEANPQKYLDIVDAEGTKELFKLLSSDQKRALETKARSDIRNREAEARLIRENARIADRQTILDRLLDDNFIKADDFINSTSLAPEEKFKWSERFRKRAEAINKGKSIVTDERVRGELEEMANDIGIGSVTKQQTLDAANQARYTDEKIDDAAYDQIRTLIEREHKSYQSTAIKEATSFGAGQLVSITIGVIESLKLLRQAKKLEDASSLRELELWNMGQYRKALNDWLTVHPEADADAIYIQSRKMITQYRRPPDEIERARADFEQRLQSGDPIPPGRVSALFPNPIIVESPFGTQNWTSQEQFDKVLKPLGYKKVGKNADSNKK